MKKMIKNCKIWSRAGVICLCMLLLSLFCPLELQAASYPVQITQCKFISADTVRVKVKVKKPSAVKGKKCYLFALDLSQNKLKGKPILQKKKAKKITYTLSFNKNAANSRLNYRFMIAEKSKNGKYKIISNSSYITNPGKSAAYTYKFPTAESKKGLQVNPTMLEDAEDLNISHTAINFLLTDFVASDWEKNEYSSYPYMYQGKKYWISKGAVGNYDRELSALKEQGTINSAILLVDWKEGKTSLIYPDGRKQGGHAYYAWNTKNISERRKLEAVISFLANRYGSNNGEHGQIVNWIVGNEVNDYGVYNYAGKKSLKQYAKIYADAFRITYNAVSSQYSNARVYISLDHRWNYDEHVNVFPGRKLLDQFAEELKSQGNIPWNLAYHAYGSPTTDPRFWKNGTKLLSNSSNSKVVNMANLSVLTNYIKKKYGSSHRIILSEQGYTSSMKGKNMEEEQAAAIAYSYYAAEADSMVDSFILTRHVDNRNEMSQGLSMGLWTTEAGAVESADKKKKAWNLYKYIDTEKSKDVSKSSLKVIGIKDWKKVIKKFNSKLYNKKSLTTGSLEQTGAYQAVQQLPANWNAYGAVSGMYEEDNQYYAYRNSSRNRNILWGMTQKFKGGQSFESAPVFAANLMVDGAKSGQAEVRIRFYSGSKIFECSRVIPSGTAVNLKVSLANWKYKNNVTKIQILTAPTQDGWKRNAFMAMTNVVQTR